MKDRHTFTVYNTAGKTKRTPYYTLCENVQYRTEHKCQNRVRRKTNLKQDDGKVAANLTAVRCIALLVDIEVFRRKAPVLCHRDTDADDRRASNMQKRNFRRQNLKKEKKLEQNNGRELGDDSTSSTVSHWRRARRRAENYAPPRVDGRTRKSGDNKEKPGQKTQK